jgi:Fur family ferric uptake transcriptional regulator/Fur family peroxide stress response transcriptional regulator
MNDFNLSLKKSGLKVTPQRVMILDELKKGGHLNVDEIYSKIKPLYSSISLATVYKNLSSLLEAGIIKEVYIPEQKQKYELKQKAHAHFFCSKCGNIRDVEVDESTLKQAFKGNEEIEDFYMMYTGVCIECKSTLA